MRRRKRKQRELKTIDRTIAQEVPFYNDARRVLKGERRKRKYKKQLTTGDDTPKLKKGVTMQEAINRLHAYEQAGLTPSQIANLNEQVKNLTERVKKLESWD